VSIFSIQFFKKHFAKDFGSAAVFFAIGLTERRSTSSGHPTVAKQMEGVFP
jgi:hypothetical protein